MSELHIEIGKRIRAARKFANITQDGLAQAIGLTRTSMSNIERGFQKTPLEKLYDIANRLNTTIYELIPNKWDDADLGRIAEIHNIDEQIAELQEQQAKLRRNGRGRLARECDGSSGAGKMIEHLKAPNGERYPVTSTRMIGEDLWVQLNMTTRAEAPMSRWLKAFDLAGLWLSNHPAIDRLRGVTPPFETDMVFTCALPPRAIVLWQPTITLTPAMAAAVSHSAGVQIVVRKPAPVITLWHGSMKAAA